MGSFYTNYTLRGPTQQSVVAALAGRSAFVSPVDNGCVVVFDEKSDEQNQEVVVELASYLSAELRCPLLAVLNHDDDILWYQLYLNGELADEYNSSPDYFEEGQEGEPSGPTGGNAQKLCGALGADSVEEVERILRKSAFTDDGYTFAFKRHADLATALGISSFGVGAGFGYISAGELPEGLEESALARTKVLSDPQPTDEVTRNPSPGYYKVNLCAVNPKAPAGESIPVGWMPAFWSDLECSERDLTEGFQRGVAKYREQLKHLGFAEVGFKKVRRFLNPNHRDNGGINYLDSSRCYFGQLIYRRFHLAARNEEKEGVVISFTVALEDGILSCTNSAEALSDSLPNHEIVRLQSEDVAVIHKGLIEHPRLRVGQRRRFVDLLSLQAWFDSNAVEVFEDRVRRGIFLRMSDYEVAIARRKLPPPLPNT
jgi:hypothetical protein